MEKYEAKAMSIEELGDAYGLTVAGISMLIQIAEWLQISESVTIDGAAREQTLQWFEKWEARELEEKP